MCRRAHLQWKHLLMKPKLALKLVPVSGLVLDFHTVTSFTRNQGGGEKNILKMKNAISIGGTRCQQEKQKQNYRNTAKKNWNIEDNNGKQTVHSEPVSFSEARFHIKKKMFLAINDKYLATSWSPSIRLLRLVTVVWLAPLVGMFHRFCCHASSQ